MSIASFEEARENGIDELVLRVVRQMEKTCIFIDNSNLFWALRTLGTDQKLDYIKLKEVLSAGRPADVRFYYSEPQNPQTEEARIRLEKQKGFYHFLQAGADYQMIKLPLYERTTDDVQTAFEKGLDCEIVFDLCRLSLTGNYKTFILVAADQDYARTVKKIRDIGVNVEVAFFKSARISSNLLKSASGFIDLDKYREELFSYRLSETGS